MRSHRTCALSLFPRLDIFSCWRADVNDVGLISITTYTQSLTHHTGAICLILAALAHRYKWISQTRQKMNSHILAISYFTFHLFQVSINDFEFNVHFLAKRNRVVTENSKDHPGRHFYFTSMFLQPPADF